MPLNAIQRGSIYDSYDISPYDTRATPSIVHALDRRRVKRDNRIARLPACAGRGETFPCRVGARDWRAAAAWPGIAL